MARTPQRILHLSPSFHPAHRYGGPVAALYDLCRAQLAAGLSVRVLTSDADGRQRIPGVGGRLLEDYGVPTFYGRVALGQDIAPELGPALWTQLSWADLVHVTGVFSVTSLLGIAGAIGAISRRRPCVVSPRGSLLPWALQHNAARKQLALRILQPLLRRVAGWHATSDEEAAALGALQQRGVLGEKAAVLVVPNGVSVEDLPPPRLGPPVLVALGRVHPVKNLELALEALAVLRRDVPDATLRIIGPETAEYGQKLRQLATALRLEQAVHFIGELTGAPKKQALAAASALWLCSHMESFGNVVLESLAAGTQVVAAQTTPWHSLPELGVGYHVAATATAFAQATRALLAEQADVAARAAVARRCQQAVRERYAWSVVETRMRALYDRARRAAE